MFILYTIICLVIKDILEQINTCKVNRTLNQSLPSLSKLRGLIYLIFTDTNKHQLQS
jgi:hypothetical protein